MISTQANDRLELCFLLLLGYAGRLRFFRGLSLCGLFGGPSLGDASRLRFGGGLRRGGLLLGLEACRFLGRLALRRGLCGTDP